LIQPDSQAIAGAAGGGDGTAVNACHAEQDAEFEGEEALQWGDKHLKDSPEECCAACQERAPRCNVWVYCGKSEGCGGGRSDRCGLGDRCGCGHWSCRVGNRLNSLRKLDDANLAFAFCDFEFGNARLCNQVDQGFQFSEIHISSVK
jgi:hypothetical protein